MGLWYLTVVYTATYTYFGLLELAKRQDLRKFMYTASLTDVIHLRHPEKSM